MPMPFAPPIILSPNARTELQVFSASLFHAAVAELTCSHCLASSRYRHPDQSAHRPRSGLLQSDLWASGDGRYLALGESGLQDAIRPGRPRMIASSTRVQVIVGGQHTAARPGARCHPLDTR